MARARQLGRHRALVWGLVGQGAASGSNLGLVLCAARAGGATALAAVSIGFGGYLVALTTLRSLVSEPLVVASSGPKSAHHRWGHPTRATQSALTCALALGVGGTLVAVAVGLLVPGVIGRGALAFAPWILPALVQDFWRSTLFRDGRERDAATSDVLRLVTMAPFAAAGVVLQSPAIVVSAWGLGLLCGAALAFTRAPCAPASLAAAARWFVVQLRSLGAALGLAQAVTTAGAQLATLMLAVLLTARDLGGLAAVETLFAANTLVSQALSLPGLPRVTAALRRSYDDARRDALLLGSFSLGLLGPYLMVMMFAGGDLLGLLFGREFSEFDRLLLPLAVAQLLLSATTGYGLLARADVRRVLLVTSRVVVLVLQLSLIVPLVARWGVVGAAWALSIGSSVGALMVAVGTLREPRRRSARVAEPIPMGAARELAG